MPLTNVQGIVSRPQLAEVKPEVAYFFEEGFNLGEAASGSATVGLGKAK